MQTLDAFLNSPQKVSGTTKLTTRRRDLIKNVVRSEASHCKARHPEAVKDQQGFPLSSINSAESV